MADSKSDRFDEDDDLKVVYCQLAMKDAHCKHLNCKGSCKELKNPASQFKKETDNQNSPDLEILFTDSTVTENKVTQGDRQKQFLVSGLTGKDLYLCGKPHCEYQAATESQLSDHMHECNLSHKGVIQCRHCSAYFKSCRILINHLSLHGVQRYFCALCPYCGTAPTAVEQHLEHHHKVSCTEIVPVDPSLKTAMFIVQPKFQVKVLPKHEPTEQTKVCSNMKEHLGLHLDQDVDPADIPKMEISNPVECPEQNEKLSGKTTNLDASSNVRVSEMSSSVTSNRFSPALSAALPLPSATLTPPPQAVPLAEPMLCERSRRMNATYHSGAKQVDGLRIKAFVRDSSEPLPSSSSVQEVRDAAATTTSLTKQATDLQAGMSVHELPKPMYAASAVPCRPSKRAATLRDRASIHGLSETVLARSQIASAEGSDTEEPSLKKKPSCTSPQQEDPTEKEEKICKVCGKECKNLFGLKMHIIHKHKSSLKWSCGYCHQKEASRKSISQHCCTKHPGLPELVEFNEGATSLNLNALEEADREPEVPGVSHEAKDMREAKVPGVSHEANQMFQCRKCSFSSDNFEIVKRHFRLHFEEFELWLSAQQYDIEKRVVRHKLSHANRS